MKICPKCKGVCRDAAMVCSGCGHEVTSTNLVDGDNLVGLRLADKYELAEYLGEGAMGWVYKGTHMTLENSVAVKIMKPQVRPDENRAARFKREAKAASRLNHPHIISVIDFGETPSGLLYIVTEFLRGVPLTELLHHEEPINFKRAVRIMSQILSALEESHNGNVVHRDLKPDNIMVSQLRGGEDFVKVLDFGIAQILDQDSQKLTQQGQLFGTPDYMAPEQVRTQEITAAADIYAAGIILFEMLTGRLPFQAENLFDVLKAHLYSSPPRLAEVVPELNYSEQLQTLIDKALEKDPQNRFACAGDFRRALRKAARLTTIGTKACPKCNQSVETSVQFCSHCGHRLHAPKEGKKSLATADTQYAVDDQKKSVPSDSQPTLDRLWSSLAVKLPLMNRKEERKILRSLIEEKLSAVQLVGTVGMGKTALAANTAREAASLGFQVHWVEPHSSNLPVSWEPVRQAVASVLSISRSPTEAELRDTIASNEGLIREYQGLSELFGYQNPLRKTSPLTRRDETIASAWKTILHKTDTPQLIVFEDIDLYDEPSRLFVERLAKTRGQGSRLLIVITSTVPLLESIPSMKTIDLKPLDRQTVDILVNELFNRPTDSWGGMMSNMAASSKGHPLWLEQALALATESGTESNQELPDLILTRLSRLPSDAQQILQALAVIGMEGKAKDVAFLLEKESLNETAVQLLSLRGFLVQEDDIDPSTAKPDKTGPKELPGHKVLPVLKLRFSHPFIVSIIRESLPAEVRSFYNRRFVQLFDSRSVPAVCKAYHFLSAGMEQDAFQCYETAGDDAFDHFDAQGAISFYRQALDIARWRLLLSEDDIRYITLNAKLGKAMSAAGDLNGALIVLKHGAGNSSFYPEIKIDITRSLAKVLMSQGYPAKAIAALRQAIGDAIMHGDAEVLTDLYLELGELLVLSGDTVQALEELNEGQDLVTAGEGPMVSKAPKNLWLLLVKISELRSSQSSDLSNLKTAMETASAALIQAERISDSTGIAGAHILLAELHRKASIDEKIDHHISQALKTLRTIGDRKGQVRCLLLAASRKNSGDSEAYREEAYQLAWEIGWPDGMKHATERTLIQTNEVA